MALTQEDVISALKECYDPEIPVNIVDLGLIYEVRMKPTEVPNLQGEDVEVEMTLTTPAARLTRRSAIRSSSDCYECRA